MWTDIYYSKDEVQKSYGYVTMIPAPGAFNIFTAVDKGIHRFKRKVLSQGFSDQAIRAFEPTMLHHMDLFVRKLVRAPDHNDDNDRWSPQLDMTEYCRHLQYDIMGEFGFGQSFQLQTKTDNHFLIDATTATSRKAGVYVQYPRLQYLHLEKLLYRKGTWLSEQFLQLMARLVRERLSAEKGSQNDLFSFLVDAKDPETGRGFTETSSGPRADSFSLQVCLRSRAPALGSGRLTTHKRGRHIVHGSRSPVLLSHRPPFLLRQTSLGNPHHLHLARRDPDWAQTRLLPLSPRLHR